MSLRRATRPNISESGHKFVRGLVWPPMSRFSQPQDPTFQRMNASLAFDQRLWPQDVAQSRAHASMLAAQGLIAEADRDALLTGLDAVARELADGEFAFEPAD